MRNIWNRFKIWNQKNRKGGFLIFLIFFVLFETYYVISIINDEEMNNDYVSYNEFNEMLSNEEVKEVFINFASPIFSFTNSEDQVYRTDNPRIESFKEDLLKQGVKVTEINTKFQDTLSSMLTSLITIILLVTVFMFFYRRMLPVNVEKKEVTEIPNVSFDNIAGNQEAKEEMQFLVDFLKRPGRYEKMGAKLPKGVILYGPPGTGKTLTAKAIAGEAKVPFFSMSGSDFSEMYVGVGAKRVRELFKEARQKAPSIIFIDEIDSLGSSRDLSSHSEDRKTLNAILNEMDGFIENSGVIVIGATNRLEDLDPAFIRPGRFDKHIAISLPDFEGRLEILKHHAKNKKLDSDVDLEHLAKITVGMSGAYLESILNEATIIATTKNKEFVTEEDIDDAYYKVVVKGHKKKRNKEEENQELEIIAWHEAGHALVGKLLGTSDVPKVTITPSTTGVGGFALMTPKKEKLQSKEYLLNRVKELYAGRIAEILLLKDENKATIGASQDIRQATNIIKSIILEYGMSERFGMINLTLLSNSRLMNDLSNNKIFVDEAIKLSNQLYQETFDLLKNEIRALSEIANRLIEKETIYEDELDKIIKEYSSSLKEASA